MCYERNGVRLSNGLKKETCHVKAGSQCNVKYGFLPTQEVFYLTYTPDDIEGNMHLDTGDKVSFYMETNKQ